MSSAQEIGKKLKNLRGNKTLEEVSSACGISLSALAMYETGKRIPRDEVKIKLAEYFNVSIEFLFFASQVHES